MRLYTVSAVIRFRRLLLLLFVCLLSVTACRVAFAPSYEAEIDRQVTAAAKLTNRLYLDMIELPADAEINSIRMQNEARKKGRDLLAMTDTLDKKFRQYRTYHRKKDFFSRGEAESYNDYIKDYWKRLLLTERHLNRKNPYPVQSITMPTENNELIRELTDMVRATVKRNKRKAAALVTTYMSDKQARLTRLYERWARGEIDEAFFQERLQDEKAMLAMELTSLKVTGKVAAEELVNGILGWWKK